MISKKVIIIGIVAFIISALIASVMISLAYQNCDKFAGTIRKNHDGLIAKECEQLGYTTVKIEGLESNLAHTP